MTGILNQFPNKKFHQVYGKNFFKLKLLTLPGRVVYPEEQIYKMTSRLLRLKTFLTNISYPTNKSERSQNKNFSLSFCSIQFTHNIDFNNAS